MKFKSRNPQNKTPYLAGKAKHNPYLKTILKGQSKQVNTKSE